MALDYQQLLALDEADPLKHCRDWFDLPPNTIYLNGNSLGPPLKGSQEYLQDVIGKQWAGDLVGAWNNHHWFEWGTKIGDKLAALIGAQAGEVVVCDNTSVNLFKLLIAVMRLQLPRNKIIVPESLFPTDLYMAQSVVDLLRDQNCQLVTVNEDTLVDVIDSDTAVVVTSQVNFRTGNKQDCQLINQRAKELGALVVWDLCHSVGAVPVTVADDGIDLAVGCTYKFLNGGPGSPAFVYVASDLQSQLQQPLSGWFGHAQPFTFSPEFEPALDVRRFQSGTPPILSMAGLYHALSIWEKVNIKQVWEKAGLLGQHLIALFDEYAKALNMEVVTPKDSANRGAQVSVGHQSAYAIIQALAAKNIVGDFREPNIMRFGLSPLFTRYSDLWELAIAMKQIIEEKEYAQQRFTVRRAVT